jgi:enoyl-CoA hydratase/carnithine racemase
LLREALRSPFDTVLELSAVYQAVCHKPPDHTEAVDAFLEKRSPRFS